MQIPTADYLKNVAEERRKAIGLSTSDILLPVPNRAGDGPRVSTLMRQHGEAIDEGEAA